MMHEIAKAKDICQEYQQQEKEAKRQRDEYILKLKQVNILHASLMNNKINEIIELQNKIIDQEKQFKSVSWSKILIFS